MLSHGYDPAPEVRSSYLSYKTLSKLKMLSVPYSNTEDTGLGNTGANLINAIRMLNNKDSAKHDSTEKLYYYMIIA